MLRDLICGALFLEFFGFCGFYWKWSNLIFGWRNWVGKYSLDIWNIVLLYLIWTVRNERNLCTFEDAESTNLHLFLI